jgi:S1-C subfamily serine protease
VPDSPASRAGIAKSDRILSLDGQPILSIADVQWVLHHAAEPATIAAEIDRGGQRTKVALGLPLGWRLGIADDWRVLNLGMCSQLVGFNFVRLDEGQAKDAGLTGKLAFRVNRRGKRLARDVQLQRGDLIVAIDGKRAPLNLGGITAYLFTRTKKGDKVELTVRRRGAEIAVLVPILQ